MAVYAAFYLVDPEVFRGAVAPRDAQVPLDREALAQIFGRARACHLRGLDPEPCFSLADVFAADELVAWELGGEPFLVLELSPALTAKIGAVAGARELDVALAWERRLAEPVSLAAVLPKLIRLARARTGAESLYASFAMSPHVHPPGVDPAPREASDAALRVAHRLAGSAHRCPACGQEVVARQRCRCGRMAAREDPRWQATAADLAAQPHVERAWGVLSELAAAGAKAPRGAAAVARLAAQLERSDDAAATARALQEGWRALGLTIRVDEEGLLRALRRAHGPRGEAS
ncbi:MAG: hypothetical protein R3A79_10840 [Nannocystaceae bacterium]